MQTINHVGALGRTLFVNKILCASTFTDLNSIFRHNGNTQLITLGKNLEYSLVWVYCKVPYITSLPRVKPLEYKAAQSFTKIPISRGAYTWNFTVCRIIYRAIICLSFKNSSTTIAQFAELC